MVNPPAATTLSRIIPNPRQLPKCGKCNWGQPAVSQQELHLMSRMRNMCCHACLCGLLTVCTSHICGCKQTR